MVSKFHQIFEATNCHTFRSQKTSKWSGAAKTTVRWSKQTATLGSIHDDLLRWIVPRKSWLGLGFLRFSSCDSAFVEKIQVSTVSLRVMER